MTALSPYRKWSCVDARKCNRAIAKIVSRAAERKADVQSGRSENDCADVLVANIPAVRARAASDNWLVADLCGDTAAW